MFCVLLPTKWPACRLPRTNRSLPPSMPLELPDDPRPMLPIPLLKLLLPSPPPSPPPPSPLPLVPPNVRLPAVTFPPIVREPNIPEFEVEY